MPAEKGKIFPETKPPGIYPDTINEHLKGTWCSVRNTIVNDQEGIARCLENIRSNKKSIQFAKERILTNHKALAALEGVK